MTGRSILCALVLFASALLATGRDSDEFARYDRANANWETVAYADGVNTGVKGAFLALQQAWQGSAESVRASRAYSHAQAAVHTARVLADCGDFEGASALLAAAGAIAKSHPVVLSRGKSGTVFQDLASLHARVVSATKADPLQGVETGYEFGKAEGGFYALQESLEVDRTAPTGATRGLADLAQDETSGTLLRIGPEGQIRDIAPVALRISVGKSESLHSRLTGIYASHEAGASGPGGYTRLSPASFLSEQERMKNQFMAALLLGATARASGEVPQYLIEYLIPVLQQIPDASEEWREAGNGGFVYRFTSPEKLAADPIVFVSTSLECEGAAGNWRPVLTDSTGAQRLYAKSIYFGLNSFLYAPALEAAWCDILEIARPQFDAEPSEASIQERTKYSLVRYHFNKNDVEKTVSYYTDEELSQVEETLKVKRMPVPFEAIRLEDFLHEAKPQWIALRPNRGSEGGPGNYWALNGFIHLNSDRDAKQPREFVPPSAVVKALRARGGKPGAVKTQDGADSDNHISPEKPDPSETSPAESPKRQFGWPAWVLLAAAILGTLWILLKRRT